MQRSIQVTGYVGKGSSCHVWTVQSIQMQDEGQKLCLKTFLSASTEAFLDFIQKAAERLRLRFTLQGRSVSYGFSAP